MLKSILNKDLPDRVLNLKLAVLFIIIIVSFGVYLNTLSNSFVYDDEAAILENSWIEDIKFIPSIFLSHSWDFKYNNNSTSNYYTPLSFIVFMMQFFLLGISPCGYHLTNMIAHTMVTVMVFFIAISLFRQMFNENIIVFPAVAALLFAVHPIHTEAVAWISAITELLMSFFYLLSFFIYVNTSEQKCKKFIVSAIFFFIATLFKLTAMTLPILLIVYDYSFKKGIFAGDLRDKAVRNNLCKRYMPFIIVSILYLSLRTYAIEGFIPEKGFIKITTYQVIINIFPLLKEYLKMLVLPVNLNILHVFHPVFSLSDRRMFTALCVIAFLILSALIAKKKSNGLFFSLSWIIIPLLPVFYIPAFTGESVLAERYLYLPSVGFVITAAILMRSIYHHRLFKGMTAPVLFLSFSIVIVLFTLWTVDRNYIWKDNYSLWIDTVKKSPDSYRAHNNLGSAYYRKGLLDDAFREYRTALLLNPFNDTALLNTGMIYCEKGKIDDAIREYQAVLLLRPDNYEAHNGLGSAYYKKGLLDDAVREYQTALSLKPDYRDAQYNLSVVYGIKKAIDSNKK